MLPGEEETRDYIHEHFAKDFRVAQDLLELEKEVLDAVCAATNEAGDQLPGQVCIAALTKLLRQHLAIRVLCERGFASEAELIVRAMFETVLVVLGMLSEGFELPEGAPERRPDVGLRARLVWAKIVINDEKYSRLVASDDSFCLSETSRNVINLRVSDVEAALGSKWMSWLRGAKNVYFGLTTASLAEKLELKKRYDVVYRFQSRAVHVLDLHDFLDSVGEESEDSHVELQYRLFPDCELAVSDFPVVVELVCAALAEVNRHFNLELKDQIEAFDPPED